MIAFAADGSKTRVHRCGGEKAEQRGKYVAEAECFACPIRNDILRAALGANTYTPERKLDTARAVKKVPDKTGGGFPACDHRLLVVLPVCCGKTLDTWQCKNTASPYYEAEIAPAHCEQCVVRKPGGSPHGTETPKIPEKGQA